MNNLLHNLILCIFICIFFIPIDTNAQPALKKANKFYALKRYPQAIKFYNKIVSKKANNLHALIGLADSYRHINAMGQASKYYQRATQHPHVEPEVFLYYGHTLKAKGMYVAAKEAYRTFAQSHPKLGAHYMKSCDFAIEQQFTKTNQNIELDPISTAFADFGPTIYRGKLIYSSFRPDIKFEKGFKIKKSELDPNFLYQTQRGNNNDFLEPVSFHNKPLGNFNQGPVSFSPDGQWVAYTNNNFSNGVRHIPSSGTELSIYIAPITPDGQFGPSFPFEHNGSSFSNGYPCWSADGKSIYFSSDRPGGHGGFDIYVSLREGNTWTPPSNLGPVVNSRGNEISPYLSENSIYFSSDYHHGFGGYDLFRAPMVEKQINTIYNMGNIVNSGYDDMSYTFDPHLNTGFIVSNRIDGTGDYDIYRVNKTERVITLRVLDSEGFPVENAVIDFTNCKESTFLTDANGNYAFEKTDDINCKVFIRKPGYSAVGVDLDKLYEMKFTTLTLSAVDKPNTIIVDSNGNNTSNTNTNPSSSTADGTSPLGQGEFIAVEGLISSINPNADLGGVSIRATRVTDGMTVNTSTDSKGNYVIGLSPNSDYILEYFKSGVIDSQKSFTTSNGSTRNAVNTIVANLATPVVENPSISPVKEHKPERSTVSENPTNLAGTFSIQVAALAANKSIETSQLEGLDQIGTVYYVPSANLNKVRVGTYKNKQDAEQVLRSIKNQGFSDAFIVTENSSAINTVDVSTKPVSVEKVYMVKLGVYRNPTASFDANTVNDLGALVQIIKNDLTIILLDGYRNVSNAKSALAIAKSRGYIDAYVVSEVNGKFVKIN